MIIFLVNEYGVAFKNKDEAIAFLRDKEYNEKKLAYYKRAFSATYSEETILYLINGRISEIELK